MSRIQIDNAFECIMDASNPKCCITIYKNDDDTTILTIIIHIQTHSLTPPPSLSNHTRSSAHTCINLYFETKMMVHSDADTKHLIAWFSNLIGCTLRKRLLLFDVVILTLCRWMFSIPYTNLHTQYAYSQLSKRELDEHAYTWIVQVALLPVDTIACECIFDSSTDWW